MSDYTPDTHYVRTVYSWNHVGGDEVADAEFDRWLESVEAAAEKRGAERERAQIVARMGAAAGMEAGR